MTLPVLGDVDTSATNDSALLMFTSTRPSRTSSVSRTGAPCAMVAAGTRFGVTPTGRGTPSPDSWTTAMALPLSLFMSVTVPVNWPYAVGRNATGTSMHVGDAVEPPATWSAAVDIRSNASSGSSIMVTSSSAPPVLQIRTAHAWSIASPQVFVGTCASVGLR